MGFGHWTRSKFFLVSLLVGPLGIMAVQEVLAVEQKGVVQASSVKAREQASFMGPVAFELKHKQEVRILEKKGTFALVESNGSKGWIPKSSLTSPSKLELRKGKGVSLSSADAMTAGKGVHDSKKILLNGQPVSEAVIDQIEAMTPEREGEMEAFIQEGGLKRGSVGSVGKRK
jgi:hypothetical protein